MVRFGLYRTEYGACLEAIGIKCAYPECLACKHSLAKVALFLVVKLLTTILYFARNFAVTLLIYLFLLSLVPPPYSLSPSVLLRTMINVNIPLSDPIVDYFNKTATASKELHLLEDVVKAMIDRR